MRGQGQVGRGRRAGGLRPRRRELHHETAHSLAFLCLVVLVAVAFLFRRGGGAISRPCAKLRRDAKVLVFL